MGNSIQNLTRQQKVAILLVSLGEELATELIRQLPEQDAKKILRTMSSLTKVDDSVVSAVLAEFSSLVESFKPGLPSGNDMARKILSKAFEAEKAQGISAFLERPLPQSFIDAEQVPSKVLWQYLERELPQTICFIMAHLSPMKSADILKIMPPDFRREVLLRLAKSFDARPEMFEVVDEILSKAVEESRYQSSQQIGGARKTAQILSMLPAQERARLLEQIESRSSNLAADIKSGLFSFEDLAKIRASDFETILKNVKSEELELALRRCPEEIASKFFGAMSSRRAEQVRENIAAQKPVSLDKVESAQRCIAELVVKLIESGQILDPLEKVV